MAKIVVTKEQYEKVRHVEQISGHKIKDVYAPVVDCVEGQWGLWDIQRCYRSFNCYIAEVELDKEAKSEGEAVYMWKLLQIYAFTEKEKGNSNVGEITKGN